MKSKLSTALHSLNFTTVVAIAATTGSLSILVAPNSAQAVNLLANSSFEASFASQNRTERDGVVTFTYQPSDPNLGWAFSGGGTGIGISNDISAYDGQKFAFIRNTSGLLSQVFSVSQATNATLDFALALRARYQPGQVVEVSLDGTPISSFQAVTTSTWTLKTLGLGLLNAGNHTIAFQGLYPGSDSTAFIDAVNISETQNANASVPEPFTVIGTLIGGTAAFRMKKKLKDSSI
jgi:hypothetical protein